MSSLLYDERYFKERGFSFKQDVRRFYPLALTLKALGIKKCLDLGCAYGALVYALRMLGIEAYGIDISEYTKSISPVSDFIVLRDLERQRIPFSNEYFDCITAINFFEHVKNLEHVIKESHRVLRRGGILYAVIPSYSKEALEDPYHVSIHPLRTWIKLFMMYGFRMSVWHYIRFWTNYLVLRLRAIRRVEQNVTEDQRRVATEPLNQRLVTWVKQAYRLIFIKVY